MSKGSESVLERSDEQRMGLEHNANEYLTVVIAGQTFGIPVLQVQDVLGAQTVTKIPLAPPEVDGALNLRGRIVTAINVRRRLGLEERNDTGSSMSVVVEHEHELYSLVIDRVGDVLNLPADDYENTPATLDQTWREISMGVYRLEKQLLIILDVPKLLNSVHT
jgi:purine-binding chemotaxis protein CheW